MNIIETKDLCFTYSPNTPVEHKALKNINVSIKQGEVIGIIGHTGSGKSSFVKLLNGLLRPSTGKILFLGEDIWQKPKNIRNLRFKVGVAFQYPEHQLFEETVYKDIAFGPINMGLSREEIDLRVKKAASVMGLNEAILKLSPFDLSGGQRRRAAIAGVIAMKPQVLVLDEPTAGLDPEGRENFLNQILDYHKQENNTVLFVSHNMEDIALISDRIMVFNNGRLEKFDTPKKVFSDVKKMQELGLDIPEITKIALKLKEKGFDLGEGIITVDDAVKRVVHLLREKSRRNFDD